jgi:hypothetical protein
MLIAADRFRVKPEELRLNELAKVSARQCAPPRSPSRPPFSAAGDALAFAVEFHGALADREVGGRLDLLHERHRLGVCPRQGAPTTPC